MKYHCPCGRFVELAKGKHYTRKGTEKVCRECMARYREADELVRQAKELARSNSTPYDDLSSQESTLDFLTNMFNLKGIKL
jgi:hypothetical protein